MEVAVRPGAGASRDVKARYATGAHARALVEVPTPKVTEGFSRWSARTRARGDGKTPRSGRGPVRGVEKTPRRGPSHVRGPSGTLSTERSPAGTPASCARTPGSHSATRANPS